MNPIVFAIRRPVTTFILVVLLGGGGVVGLSEAGMINVPFLKTPKAQAYIRYVSTNAKKLKAYVATKADAYLHKHEEQVHHEPHKIVVTSPETKAVTITQQYVCQIHSQRHIEVRALENGYLEAILVKEGQAVKKGTVMFKVVPTLYKARLDAEQAEADLARLEYENTNRLFKEQVVSQNEVKLLQAKLARAVAKAELAKAELNFTEVKAPFDGIVDRLQQQLGSLVSEGDILTTLSDNSLMWVYFNVPEANYLEYMAATDEEKQNQKLELVLANGRTFQQSGKIGAIEAKFNNQTGTVPFRADFPNPKGLLRHGQTGNMLIHRVLADAVIIPQRATFEILNKQYVYVVDKDDVVQQREIGIDHVMDDIYVVNKGVKVGEKIVLEGIRELRAGEKVAYEFRTPEKVVASLKYRAE